MRSKALWLALGLSVCATVSFAQQAYTITQVLGPGANPTALSQDGWVVGDYTFCCNEYFSFYWKPDVQNGTTGAITKIDNGFWASLQPTGVNGGHITMRGFQTGLAGAWGLVWHDGTFDSYYGCNPPSWGPNYGVDLWAINANGVVAGESCTNAAVWSAPNTLPQLLGTSDGAHAINNNGVVTGYAGLVPSFGGGPAFISVGNSLQYIPLVPGTAECNGTGINDQNEVVGTCITRPDNGSGRHPWIYSSGQLTEIGCVPGGCYEGDANSINNQSVVVGNINDGTFIGSAYMWDRTNGLRHINSLLPANAPVMDRAVAINNAGQILTVAHDGSIYLLTPAPTADLSVTNTADASVTYLDNVTYSITVTNGGPSTATGVTVTDTIPANTSFVSATPSAGSCSGTATVTCAIGQLASGASANVTIVVATTAAGTLTNTATVSADQTDPVSSNNSATAVTTVNPKQPTLTWSTPSAIPYGTALSATQLDASADTAGTFTYAPAAGTVLHAGSQTLKVSFAPSSSNYTSADASVTLNVQAVSLTITANDQTKAYGAPLPALTASYSGFVNGDTAANLTAAPVLSTSATASSHVSGNPYAIAASGAASSDYTITYMPGSLTITPVSLTITAANQTKAYGAAVPALTASYSGFVNGDTAASLTSAPALNTTATASSHVSGNPYAISASGAASSDYTIAYVPGSLTVTPVPLTITANDQSKLYGAALPTFTASYSGFVNGDSASSLATQPVFSTTATTTSSVGTYPISASGAADSDYTIAYAPGTLTIGAAPTATTIGSSLNPALTTQSVTFTASVTSGVPGLIVSSGTVTFTANSTTIGTSPVVGGKATFTTNSLAAGSDAIGASFGNDANYVPSSASLTEVIRSGGSIADLIAKVTALNLNAGNRNSLLAKLNAAQASINRGDRVSAANQLGAFINEVEALEQSGRLAQATGDALITEAQLVIASL